MGYMGFADPCQLERNAFCLSVLSSCAAPSLASPLRQIWELPVTPSACRLHFPPSALMSTWRHPLPCHMLLAVLFAHVLIPRFLHPTTSVPLPDLSLHSHLQSLCLLRVLS